MLKVFRDNLKYLSWVLWLVVAVFILFVFVDFGGTIPDMAPPPTEAAAVVGGEAISYGELQRAYRQTEEAYRQAYGAQFTPELARQLQLPLQVLEQLVRQRILADEAERIGLSVSDGELQKAVLRLPVFQDESGRFVGAERYRNIVRSIGYGAPEEFEEAVRSDLLLSKLERVLSDNIVVADEDVERAYREEAETAKIDYIRVPVARFRDEEALAAEEVETYFRDNIEDFRLPERRAVDYLLVDADAVRQELTVTDEDLLAYYNANAADYETEEQVRARQILLLINETRDEEQARREMEEIRARIEAGEDFAQLASELSDDAFTAAQGGEMAPFGRGQILPEVEAPAFEAEPGDLVGPIRSPNAYHLLEILAHTPGGIPPFEEMQEAVRRRVLSERAREAAEARATELAERIRREEIGSTEGLEQLAAGDAAVSYRTTRPFGRSENVPGVGRSTPFSEAAFGLELNEVSDPVRVGSGWAVVRLTEIEEPRLPELAEVDADVRAALRDLRAEAEALERLAAFRREILAGSSLEEVAQSLELTVETSSAFGRNEPLGGSLGSNREIAQAALELEAGDVGEPVVMGSEVVLFRVAERKHFDSAEFAENKEAKREELAAQRLDELLATVVAERREAIEITYDPQMSENLGLAG